VFNFHKHLGTEYWPHSTQLTAPNSKKRTVNSQATMKPATFIGTPLSNSQAPTLTFTLSVRARRAVTCINASFSWIPVFHFLFSFAYVLSFHFSVPNWRLDLQKATVPTTTTTLGFIISSTLILDLLDLQSLAPYLTTVNIIIFIIIVNNDVNATFSSGYHCSRLPWHAFGAHSFNLLFCQLQMRAPEISIRLIKTRRKGQKCWK